MTDTAAQAKEIMKAEMERLKTKIDATLESTNWPTAESKEKAQVEFDKLKAEIDAKLESIDWKAIQAEVKAKPGHVKEREEIRYLEVVNGVFEGRVHGTPATKKEAAK